MSVAPFMSVQEVADALDLSPVVVREHLADGGLLGRRLGRSWAIDPRSVEAFSRNRPRPGRPMSPSAAWAVLLTASGDTEGARTAAGSERAYYRAVRWVREHSLVDDRSRLRRRAEIESFDLHPAERSRLAASPHVALSGSAAGGLVGLVGGSDVLDAYAPASRRADLMAEHVLVPGDGPALLRWVPDDLWSAVARDGVVPDSAVLLDLVESDDPRARREAKRRLNELTGSP